MYGVKYVMVNVTVLSILCSENFAVCIVKLLLCSVKCEVYSL